MAFIIIMIDEESTLIETFYPTIIVQQEGLTNKNYLTRIVVNGVELLKSTSKDKGSTTSERWSTCWQSCNEGTIGWYLVFFYYGILVLYCWYGQSFWDMKEVWDHPNLIHFNNESCMYMTIKLYGLCRRGITHLVFQWSDMFDRWYYHDLLFLCNDVQKMQK